MESQCPVAKFVRRQIQVLGKSQVEIAAYCGFDKPNVITMIKQGKTKLPMTKVVKMGSARYRSGLHAQALLAVVSARKLGSARTALRECANRR